MKNLRNTAQLIGRLGADPEVRTLTNGNKVTNFSMAVDDSYKNSKGEKVDRAYWFNIVAWGKIGEIAAEYLSKGEETVIEGKLTNRSYEAKDGTKRYVTEVVLNEILLIGGQKQNQPTQEPAQDQAIPEDDSDDLPF